MNLRSTTILIVILCSESALALDPEACKAAAQNIDDRIAAGNHPAQNVAIATQLRDGIMQSCSFLDEVTLANMTQGLDMLLPGANGGTATPQSGNVKPQQSVADREAEREAQRAEAAERRAARDKRRAEARAREEAEQNLISDVAMKPPTGRSAIGQFMSRPDTMWGASIVDWDVFENKARLLYETTPSREQGRLPDAARHFYVVEIERNDNVVQRHVTQTKIGRTVTAALVPGRDEIIFQWHEGNADRSVPVTSVLERWSISSMEMLSSSPAPRLQGPKWAPGPEHHFQLVTARGELMYAATVPLESGPSPKTAVTWLLASLDGEVRDRGLIEHDNEKILTSNWFRSASGGAGLILDVMGVGENGIDSQLKTDTIQIGSAEIQPVVFSERRLYVAGGTETGSHLPAFERRLMWLGLENLDQSTMISGESTRLMSEAEGEYQVNDTTVSQSVAGRNRMVVAPIAGGHAVLIKSNQRDNKFPPTRGLWLQEFPDSESRRDTYLNPDAEHLGSLSSMLASGGGSELYVASTSHVLRLNDARELVAYAESSATDANIQAIAAIGDSVWLFGEDRGGTALRRVWVERIQF